MPLSDAENSAIGILCGATDCTLLQSTNYWKNAQQQGLPFTLNPSVLYRGYTVNVLQNAFCVMSQFYLAGVLKNAMTGGKDRELNNVEKIVGGVGAGAISSIVAGPMDIRLPVVMDDEDSSPTQRDATPHFSFHLAHTPWRVYA